MDESSDNVKGYAAYVVNVRKEKLWATSSDWLTSSKQNRWIAPTPEDVRKRLKQYEANHKVHVVTIKHKS